MKRRRLSTNHKRAKHNYLILYNWLPGGECCFWHTAMYSQEQKDRFDSWAERMQGRIKENLITNNRAER